MKANHRELLGLSFNGRLRNYFNNDFVYHDYNVGDLIMVEDKRVSGDSYIAVGIIINKKYDENWKTYQLNYVSLSTGSCDYGNSWIAGTLEEIDKKVIKHLPKYCIDEYLEKTYQFPVPFNDSNEVGNATFMKEDILKIINHYGLNYQLKYFQSEVFELNEAIVETTMKRREMEGKTPKIVEPTLETYRLHIAEELADVMVMLKQFQYYYEISDEEVEDVMKYKVQRQLERIENEEVNDVRAMGEEKKGRR